MEYSKKLDILENILLKYGKSWDILGKYIFQSADLLTDFVLRVTHIENNQDFNKVANYYLRLI